MGKLFQLIIEYFIAVILVLWAFIKTIGTSYSSNFSQKVFCDHDWLYSSDKKYKLRKCSKCKSNQWYDFYYNKWKNY
jgi:hypothetical protein